MALIFLKTVHFAIDRADCFVTCGTGLGRLFRDVWHWSKPNLAPKVMDMGGLRKGVGLKMSPAKWRA